MRVGAAGVPLMVHVLLSIDSPAGSAGEALHVAPVTLTMPLPEPALVSKMTELSTGKGA